MKLKPIALLFLLAFCAGAMAQATDHPKTVQVDILIPGGFPVVIEAAPAEGAPSEGAGKFTVYQVRAKVGPDVRKILLAYQTVGADGIARGDNRMTLDSRRLMRGGVAWDAASDVRRLVLVVERVETDAGVWVLDGEDQHADMQAVIERGVEALPKARLITRP